MKIHLLILILTQSCIIFGSILSVLHNFRDNSFLYRMLNYSSNFFLNSGFQKSLTQQVNIAKDDPYQLLNRDSRFLPIFSIITFNNGQCLSSSGDNGTCYPPGECKRRGGAVNGRCAGGYGVCCIFSKSCGSTTFQNNTYFTNNGFRMTGDGSTSCSITILKSTRNVCQYRLDFNSFNIGKPNSNGVCVNDQFSVAGSATVVPPICGVNSGNHMYIDVGPGNIPVTLTITTGGQAIARTWKIKITHVRCDSETRALNGCLQYFTGERGTIRSYNFDSAGGQQLANQDYTACIRTERNFCGIRYSACSDIQLQVGADGEAVALRRSRTFSITGTPEDYVGNVGAQMCQTDWVFIPCATNNGRVMQTGSIICQDRLCGNVFNSDGSGTGSSVFSYVRPFRIVYHTDATEPASTDLENRGFCLNYVQQPCAPKQ